MTEKQWQQRILDLAALRGWLVYHPFDSRRSTPGWPDLSLVRGGRLVLAELKSPVGKLTTAQTTWLEALRFVRGVEVHVWRPNDWDLVQQVLR